MEYEWWEKVLNPVRRVWNGVAVRLGIRKRGLLKLRRDVRACEYEDVHIMWEMLRRSETENARLYGENKDKDRQIWSCFKWARCTPHLCRSF